jgi:putative Ig domain-containing protein
MTIAIASTATAHVYKITVTGTSGAISNSTTVTVRVMKHSVVKVQGLQTVQPGQTVSLTISPMALESGDVVTMSALGLPQGATFDASTGLFTWTPALSQGGTYTITFIAMHDGTPALADYQFVEITVQKEAAPCFICRLFPPTLSIFWLVVLGTGVGLFAAGTVGAVRVYKSDYDPKKLRVL